MSFPYSARIARPNSKSGEFGYRSEDCVVQLHKGHSGWSTDSHVTDVVASHHRGQRLALRNPRQRLIPLTLGALRLPSKPYSPCLRTNQASSVRLRIRWRSNSANPRLLFALTTATICWWCAECASLAKKRSQFWDRSHCRMHYGRFGVAGGGVSPGAIIGLLGGAAG